MKHPIYNLSFSAKSIDNKNSVWTTKKRGSKGYEHCKKTVGNSFSTLYTYIGISAWDHVKS